MEQFNLLYYFIYSVFSIPAIIFAMYVDIKKKNYNTIGRMLTCVFFLVIALHFGFRDLEVGSDTEMYKWMFLTYFNTDFGIQVVFKSLIVLVHFFTNNYVWFLFIISLLYVSIIFWSINVFMDSFQSNFFLIGFTFVSIFFFSQLGINIIRQGLSLSLVLLAICYYLKNPKNLKMWIIPFTLSLGIHSSSLVVFLLFILIVSFKKISIYYYYIWYFVLLFISALGGSILSLGTFLNYFLVVDEGKADYYIRGEGLGTEDYVVGFKLQFAIFNTIFLFIFSYINFKLLNNSDEKYHLILKYYILISSAFFMMFQIPFSDRWGIMSWVIIPFLMAPLFNFHNNSRHSFASVFFLIFIFIFFNIYNS